MNAWNWGALVLILLVFGLACALGAWSATRPADLGTGQPAVPDHGWDPRPRHHREVIVEGNGATTLLVLTGGLLAIAGGGPLTALVFEAVDRREPADESMDGAAAVLRGGTWIGGLERAAIYATLVAGWPEGLAVVLAVKGLGPLPRAACGGGRRPHRRRRALHHRHLHQRALGGRLRGVVQMVR